MKLVAKREALMEVLASAGGVVPARAVRDCLRGALFEPNKAGGVDVLATDLEVSIRHTLAVESMDGEAAVVLPCATLLGILGECAEDLATLETEGTKGILTIGSGRFEMLGYDPADFPEMPGLPDGPLVEVPGKDLAEMIDRTVFAAAREPGRYALNGVYLRSADGVLELVGTDGHRLAYYARKQDGSATPKCGVVIPVNTVRKVRRLCSGLKKDEAVKIGLQGQQLIVACGPVVIASTLVEGVFPKYKQVIPKDCDLTATVNREALSLALRKVAYLANADSKRATLTFSAGACRIETQSESNGLADVSIEAEWAGEKLAIELNTRYLIEGLAAITADKVKIEMRNGGRPIIVRDGPDFMYVQMPIQR